MRKGTIDKAEREKRLLMLQDYRQWRSATGSNSRMAYAQEKGIDLQYLINCLKWHYEACKREEMKSLGVPSDRGRAKELPKLVPVTRKAAPAMPGPSPATKNAISIRARASSIDIAGDIAPALLGQLLSSLGALDVL